MTNPINMTGFSDMVTKDMMEKLHNFLSKIYVTLGLTKGKTLLPLPSQDTITSQSISQKDKAHIL